MPMFELYRAPTQLLHSQVRTRIGELASWYRPPLPPCVLANHCQASDLAAQILPGSMQRRHDSAESQNQQLLLRAGRHSIRCPASWIGINHLWFGVLPQSPTAELPLSAMLRGHLQAMAGVELISEFDVFETIGRLASTFASWMIFLSPLQTARMQSQSWIAAVDLMQITSIDSWHACNRTLAKLVGSKQVGASLGVCAPFKSAQMIAYGQSPAISRFDREQALLARPTLHMRNAKYAAWQNFFTVFGSP